MVVFLKLPDLGIPLGLHSQPGLCRLSTHHYGYGFCFWFGFGFFLGGRGVIFCVCSPCPRPTQTHLMLLQSVFQNSRWNQKFDERDSWGGEGEIFQSCITFSSVFLSPSFPEVAKWNLELKNVEIRFCSWTPRLMAIYLSEVTVPTSGQILHRVETWYSGKKKNNM